MTGHGEKLSRNKEKAISALLSQPSIPEAAKVVGIGERTLWRWLKLESFMESYRKARREVVQQAIALVQGGLSEAVRTLQNVLNDDKAPASARVSAARVMIDMGLKSAVIEDLERRIAEIEKTIKKRMS